MAKGSTRGSDFERNFCYEFSRWLTQHLEEPRDDVVWRTSGSGSRSTTRAKSGKTTHGSTGDIEATDPIASPFFQVCSIELKYGYGTWCVLDVLDKRATTSLCQFEQFWAQAVRDALSVSPNKQPILITRRTNRRCVVFCARSFFSRLISLSGRVNANMFFIHVDLPDVPPEMQNIACLPLPSFYDWIDPQIFVGLAKEITDVTGTMP